MGGVPRSAGPTPSAPAALRRPWLSRVRAVLFDLDNTLFDHTRASREALIEAAREFEPMVAVEAERLCDEFTRHNDACWVLAVRGEMTREELTLARFARTLAALRVSGVVPDRLSEAYLARYRHRPAEVPDARDTVLRLREAFGVGVVTNGFPDLVEDKLAAIGLAGALHPIVVADRLEVMKPRPDAFLAALEELRLDPPEALYVGDSLDVDVAGARAAGLPTCWFDRLALGSPAEAPRPDLTIRSLAELPELLGA